MCGIFGFISQKTFDFEDVAKLVSNSIKHRGPDSHHHYYDKKNNALIGHRRLSIIDLSSNADQPYTYNNISISFNGEIYNYKELKDELLGEGVLFDTESDTEVLIKVYDKWGVDGFSKLNGMFAVAFYDKNINKLILLRDRIGEKPLLYFNSNRTFAFSSEAKSFKYFPYVQSKLSTSFKNLKKNIHTMWADDNIETSVNGINRLPPGSYLILDLDSYAVEIKEYWSLCINPVRSTYPEAVEKYRKLLLESIKIRCRSDCGVALMLSGGLDSSLIASMMKSIGIKFETYTLKFDSAKSEHKKAKEISEYLGVKNTTIHIDYEDIFLSLKENIWLYDDLTTFDPGVITTYVASKSIKSYGEKVVILGEGSDEINAGYGKFKVNVFPYSFFPLWIKNSIVYYASSRNNYSLRSFVSSVKSLSLKLRNIKGSYLQKLTGNDILNQLPNHLLMKVDRGTMAASLEARAPFLDHNLIEFVFNLPDKFKLVNLWGSVRFKRILQDVAKPYLPKQVLTRKKFGMMLPLSEFISENGDSIQTLFVSNKKVINKILPDVNFNVLLENVSNQDRGVGYEWLIWRVLVVVFWVNYSKVI